MQKNSTNEKKFYENKNMSGIVAGLIGLIIFILFLMSLLMLILLN